MGQTRLGIEIPSAVFQTKLDEAEMEKLQLYVIIFLESQRQVFVSL